uniref:Uncharacterized protein n=1 Tax=Romanomermis culicivorax TaxID=13658 RepID=A0A915J4M7_ROMCU
MGALNILLDKTICSTRPLIEELTSDDEDEDLLELWIPPPLIDEPEDARRMAPDPTHYDHAGNKCSFDYIASCSTLGFKGIEKLKDIKCKPAIEPIRDLLIGGRFRQTNTSYIDQFEDRPDLLSLCSLNPSQMEAIRLSEKNYISIIQQATMASTNSTEVRHGTWKALNEGGGKEGQFGLLM